MAKTQPDRIAIKRQLSLLGSVDWWLTNLLTNIIFQAPEPTRYGDWERKGRVTDF